MAHELTAAVFPALPGAVRLTHLGDPMTGTIVRLDGALAAQPVRNFSGSTGAELVIDCEAPLGRPVSYSLLDSTGAVLASSGTVTCPAPDGGRGVLRSVLRPRVSWLYIEAADVQGTEWESSTTVHNVVGSDTPIVVSEVRQRRTETITLLARSIGDADRIVDICRDGTLLLLRMPPCAGVLTRDALFYPMAVSEARWGRKGYRLVSIDAITTRFVPGDTEEPPFDFDFAALATRAATFGELRDKYANFGSMALDLPKAAGR